MIILLSRDPPKYSPVGGQSCKIIGISKSIFIKILPPPSLKFGLYENHMKNVLKNVCAPIKNNKKKQ